MGQKVHPIGVRLGFIKDWNSIWYADPKDYASKLGTDIKVRNFLRKKLSKSLVSKIIIERPAQNAKIIIHTSRPGIIIGKRGEDVEILKNAVTKMIGIPVQISIKEVRKPETDAKLVSESIVSQLEKRMMFRRVIKRASQNAMKMGAKGVKILVKGRLGGAEIARSEGCKEGSVPLHTFRADIDYASSQALTTYGILGVKVWIFKGEVLKTSDIKDDLDESKSKRL